jgi:DNA helicase II / ATP-dependent DNA helicase PcrA
MTPAEIEERARLNSCQARIQDAMRQIDARLDEHKQDVESQKTYMWDARRDMDHIEKISARQSIEQTLQSADALQARRRRLLKLARSPYFGRFDFVRKGDDPAQAEAIYVGVHHFRDEAAAQTLVGHLTIR